MSWRDALYAELRRVITPVEATILLRAELAEDTRWLPDAELTADVFWHELRRQVGQRPSDDAERALVGCAAREYPGNAVFRETLSRIRGPGGTRDAGQPSGSVVALVLVSASHHTEFLNIVRDIHDSGADFIYVRKAEGAWDGEAAIEIARALADREVASLRGLLVAAGASERVVVRQETYRHRPYLIGEFTVQGPDGQPFQVEGVPSSLRLRDLVRPVLDSYGTASPWGSPGRPAAALSFWSGDRRLIMSDRLHDAGVGEDDELHLRTVDRYYVDEPARERPTAVGIPEQPVAGWELRASVAGTARLEQTVVITVYLWHPGTSAAGFGGRGAPARGDATAGHPFDVSTGSLRIRLSAILPNGVSAPDGADREIVVRPGQEPSPVGLPVRVHGLHTYSVVLNAWAGGTYLGRLRLPVRGTLEATQTRTVGDAIRVDTLAPERGHVTLQCFPIGRGRLQFQLLCDANGAPVEVELDDYVRYFEKLRTRLQKIASMRSPSELVLARKEIQDYGIDMWRKLVPQTVKEQFLEIRDSVDSFSLAATKDAQRIPWELLYPITGSPADDRGFLVDSIAFSRNPFQPHPKDRQISLRRPAFVLGSEGPQEELAHARAELEYLRRKLGGEPRLFGRIGQVVEWVEGGEGGLLHLACHNGVDEAGLSALPMRDGMFRPVHLGRSEEARTLADRAALVFLNACGSACLGDGLVELAGWANSFMAAGARNFIGTQWPVAGDTARRFAEVFYEALVGARQPVGHALHTARTTLREGTDDASRLAYALYGEPWGCAAE
ncbi:CHAT domain-containing protein [Streptomyces sp. NPDC048242]|uniref:CHAT domain-containing protein n=1 Tax=Streptomyces sp. NPDC048242 TaxID=3155026 RepID=UPI00342DE500